MILSATVGRPVRIEGRGIFSGERCLCTVRPWENSLPAPLTFSRGGKLIPALAQRFGKHPNCTTFVSDAGESIAVTEHLFAALWAAGIDHALIEVNRAELPNHDGSAITLYEEIAAAGRTLLGERRALQLDAPIRVEAPDGAYIELTPYKDSGAGVPAGHPPGSAGVTPVSGQRRDAAATGQDADKTSALQADAGIALPLQIDYSFSHARLGDQRLVLDITRESAVREILPARTFATREEAEALIAAGLLHNTHTDDAILMMPAAGTHDASGALTPHAYVPSTPLRFSDEFARHKVLDLLGDIYCTGIEISGGITAVRSGHALNRLLAVELSKLL